MTVSSKRVEYLARTALVLTIIFFTAVLLLGRSSEFFAVYAVSYLILAAVLIWFILCFQFHQKALAEQEKLDTAQLTSQENSSTIFQAKKERETLFALQQQRPQLVAPKIGLCNNNFIHPMFPD